MIKQDIYVKKMNEVIKKITNNKLYFSKELILIFPNFRAKNYQNQTVFRFTKNNRVKIFF